MKLSPFHQPSKCNVKTQSLPTMSLRNLLFIVPFFFVCFFLVRPTVPTYDPFWTAFWGGFTALAMTTTAWIAMHMFLVIVKDEKQRKNEQ